MKNLVISQTPYRLSLLGGGSDFPEYFRNYGGGAVLTLSLGRYVRVIVKRRFDQSYKVTYTRSEEPVMRAEDIEHDLIRESLLYVQQLAPDLRGVGLEIVTMGDVPAGTGLGSSSAVTVGTLAALYALADIPVSKTRLAADANMIERDIVNRPIGWQDAYGCALGGCRIVQFLPNDQVKTQMLLFPDFAPMLHNLMLFYTGKSRDATEVLADVRGKVDGNHELFHGLARLAQDGYRAVASGNYAKIGLLLQDAWNLKRATSKKVSNDYLNYLLVDALRAGAVGGKVTGAGGGGCLVLYVPHDRQQAVRDSSNLIEIPVSVDMEGTKVIYESY